MLKWREGGGFVTNHRFLYGFALLRGGEVKNLGKIRYVINGSRHIPYRVHDIKLP